MFGNGISGRDMVLLAGGLFLLWKASHEIFLQVEAREGDAAPAAKASGAGATVFWATIAQIAVVDIVFSLDSVITAVGMVDELAVMVAAVIAAVGVMLFAAGPIGNFVDRHPSVKVLALSFLVMVGMALTAEAFDVHIPKGYLYAAMAFSLGVEMLNIRARDAPALAGVRSARGGQLADDDVAAVATDDVAAGRQVLHHPVHHLARRADAIGDVLLGQLLAHDALAADDVRELHQGRTMRP